MLCKLGEYAIIFLPCSHYTPFLLPTIQEKPAMSVYRLQGVAIPRIVKTSLTGFSWLFTANNNTVCPAVHQGDGRTERNVEIMPDVKDYLLSYREKVDDINYLCDRIEALEDKIYRVGGVRLSDMPKNPSPEVDRLSHQIAVVLDLKEELEEAQQNVKAEYKKINSLINKLESAKERDVIKSRYIDLFKWEEINNIMFGSQADFNDKEESYLRRIFIIQKSGLNNLNRIYSEYEN